MAVEENQDYAGMIFHPREGATLPPSFVAFGIVDAAVFQVVGRLVQDGQTRCWGQPIPLAASGCWALYFRKVFGGPGSLPCTLEVFGLYIDASGALSVRPIDAPRDITIVTGTYMTKIRWPPSNENGICSNNFVAYGGYDSPGTISGTLSGGCNANNTSRFQDPSTGFWSVGFDPFQAPTDPCTLSIYLDGVLKDSTSNLGFQNC
jgi:hypothetical protein